MKILHIVPGLRSGGVAQVVYDLSKNQRSKGWDVKILSIHKNNYDDNVERFTKIGVPVEILTIKNRFDFRIIKKLIGHFLDRNIIHVHLFPNQLYCCIATKFIPMHNRPKLITTEHNTWNNRRKYKLMKLFDRVMYNAYDKIIAISPQTHQSLSDWLKHENICKKIITINNGVNIDKYKVSTTNYLRSTLNIPKNNKIITMVARMTHPKDPITLVKATALIENLNVVFVGDGPLNNDILEEAKKLGITDRVHTLGLRRDVPQILAESNIGCLSTKWDGFGLVAVEYMAAGLPVLVTDVPGLREVVDNPRALFPYGDHIRLADKIRQLLTNQEYYNLQKNLSLKQCENYKVERMISLYNSLYFDLVSLN